MLRVMQFKLFQVMRVMPNFTLLEMVCFLCSLVLFSLFPVLIANRRWKNQEASERPWNQEIRKKVSCFWLYCLNFPIILFYHNHPIPLYKVYIILPFFIVCYDPHWNTVVVYLYFSPLKMHVAKRWCLNAALASYSSGLHSCITPTKGMMH